MIWSQLRAWLSPYFVPTEIGQQPAPLSAQLPYEQVLTDGHPVVLLSDGGIGVVWQLRLLEHEMVDNERLAARCRAVAELLGHVQQPDQVAQLIWETRPAWEVDGCSTREDDDSAAAQVAHARRAHVEGLAAGGTLGRMPFRTMERRLFLTLRAKGVDAQQGWGSLLGVLSEVEAFTEQVRALRELAGQIEDGLAALGFEPQPCHADQVLHLLRWVWHDEADLREDPAVRRPHSPAHTLRSQIGRSFVRQHCAGLQVGQDSWELLSWIQQPDHVRHGLFTLLLSSSHPLRAVLTIRPCVGRDTLDLSIARTQLSVPLLGGARKRRHLAELDHVDTAQVHGEHLFWASLQIAVKNEGVPLEELPQRGVGRHLAHQLSQATGIDFALEQGAMPGLFLMTQPLAHTPGTAWFTGRELRVLTSALAAYLPIFGGFSGTTACSGRRVQLVHSRAGDPISLDPRASKTAPHTAVLGSTGAGKSFYLANLVAAELGAHPDARLFIIDSLTSYRVLGEVLGEEGGFALVQPPSSSPTLWDGELTTERLGVLVGLLRMAMGLVDPDFTVRSEHELLLEGAIRKTFGDLALDARTEMQPEGGEGLFGPRAAADGARPLPRLSDVIANLAPMAAEQGCDQGLVGVLRTKLSAFYGEGRYASLFDAAQVAPAAAPTPRITLYDLGAIEDDTLRALTMSVCVAEVVRHVMRPENRGQPGVLLLDEAGVLLSQPGSSGEALAEFAKRAWKTFRKLDVCCIGSTNDPADYLEKPGCRAVWANSPNRVLLRLKPDDLRMAQTGDLSRGQVPLFEDELLGQIAGSLRVEPGAYSQGVWWSEEARGSFTFVPNGQDYWLAASKPLEVDAFLMVSDALGGPGHALQWLAERHPLGVRDSSGELRALTRDEVLA